MNTNSTPSSPTLAFIGGGNMASAILGGLIRGGTPVDRLIVVEPWEAQRDKLRADFGIEALAEAGPALARADAVVWAVKPQSFQDAARPLAAPVGGALHLSVMAGIRSDAIAQAAGTERVVRSMPNTPALIGMGITGLYARPAVTADDRALVEHLLAATGERVWVRQESDLDAVTALSGSGPAYVFYFIETMMAAAEQMGLGAEAGKQLAIATFAGATELARRSPETPATLRERVTSKGGTTYAALTALNEAGVNTAFITALKAAQARARELGDEFGR
ncbi:pyrroline-5-carboxylate reductase [Leptothrix discophora]|uniref:Pyrroline-5-carboxylate reductase n=1 Tax=Leptothrix discophora TaxID=89 RepID=A0ABT9G514_LEPDI|nr:pyrroline-5-carboxylate reductase [Leptothrix discophora]MDP4301574.1 pyrroline-5-carboxylate reductase [Leptothrix discophora]